MHHALHATKANYNILKRMADGIFRGVYPTWHLSYFHPVVAEKPLRLDIFGQTHFGVKSSPLWNSATALLSSNEAAKIAVKRLCYQHNPNHILALNSQFPNHELAVHCTVLRCCKIFFQRALLKLVPRVATSIFISVNLEKVLVKAAPGCTNSSDTYDRCKLSALM